MKCYSIKLRENNGNEHEVKMATVDCSPEHIAASAKKTLFEGKHIDAEPIIESIVEINAI